MLLFARSQHHAVLFECMCSNAWSPTALDPHFDTRGTKIAAIFCFELVSSGFRPFIESYELSRSKSFGGSDLADAIPGGVFCRTRFRARNRATRRTSGSSPFATSAGRSRFSWMIRELPCSAAMRSSAQHRVPHDGGDCSRSACPKGDATVDAGRVWFRHRLLG